MGLEIETIGRAHTPHPHRSFSYTRISRFSEACILDKFSIVIESMVDAVNRCGR
jgi:hypothetical protein